MKTSEQAITLYAAYPRKVGRGAAIKSITRALKTATFEELLEAVETYARARENQDRQYTPYPATWFNQQRWLDDRSEWFAAEEVNSAEAFEKLRVAIRDHGIMGRRGAAVDLDPQIMSAAEKIGWQRLCEMTEFNRDTMFQQFDNAYKSIARSGT